MKLTAAARPFGVTTLLLSLAGLGLLTPAAHAGTSDAKIVVSKHKSGPFDSSVHVNLSDGESRNLYLKVKNKGSDKIAFEMQDDPDSEVIQKWFTGFSGGSNITETVENDYNFTLEPDEVRRLRWKVKLISGSACVYTLLSWPPSNSDEVLAALDTTTCVH
jgi:hypothetical protein